MNEFTLDLQRAARELRELPDPAPLEAWALRLEAAAGLSSGIALQKEAFAIARGLLEAGIPLAAAPAFPPVLETLRQRWERANSCCRR